MTITIDELKQTIKEEIEERKKQSSFDVSDLELFVRLLNQLDTSAEQNKRKIVSVSSVQETEEYLPMVTVAFDNEDVYQFNSDDWIKLPPIPED